MASEMIGVLIFVILLVTILNGVPIYASLLLCAFVGFILVGGPVFAVTQFTNAPFLSLASYNFAVFPMFMLLGVLAAESGVATNAYFSIRKWMGSIRGGLLMATIVANGVFGACSGNSMAASTVFCKIAMPELKRYGYDEDTSMGCITAAGALSALIPPSVGILMFAMLTDLSIGRGLMSGIGPGILAMAMLMITTRIVGAVSPGKIPQVREEDKRVPIKEKIRTLPLLVPIVCLFMLVIGDSFLGWFSTTVGGAIGALAVFLYAIFKRIPFKTLIKCIWEAAVMNASMLPLIMGGSLFGRAISLSGLASYMANMVSSFHMPAFFVVLLILVFYVICGCLLPVSPIIIITAPIVFPILEGLGFNPYVMLICIVFVIEMAGITPPVGMNTFVVANLCKVDPARVFRGSIPYLICEVVVVILLIAFPSITTFIPTLLMGAD